MRSHKDTEIMLFIDRAICDMIGIGGLEYVKQHRNEFIRNVRKMAKDYGMDAASADKAELYAVERTGDALHLSPEEITALRFILYAPPADILSFLEFAEEEKEVKK